ncbi:cytochrome P450 [Glonium stellatum]|uniref:Cytochrome P450 n=1 Tax=Glonium stellatum TaxID=574774 RepID=A0A8E2EXC4_9PEZI|nr:cytochrome P450 [Glonium stellatum]
MLLLLVKSDHSVTLGSWLAVLACYALPLWFMSLRIQNPWLVKIIATVKARISKFIYRLWAKEIIRDAYSKARGQPFNVFAPESRLTFVSSAEHINDIARAANDELSLHSASKALLKPGYTMNGFNWHDQRGVEGIGFVRTLRTLLTNHLPRMTLGVRVIIDRNFAMELEKKEAVNAFSLIKRIVTKISGLAFFGRDLMEDEEFMRAALKYNEDVLYGSEVLGLLPKFLVPIVGAVMPRFLTCQEKLYNGLVEVIEQRLRSSNSEGHEDVIQWIINTSPKATPWSAGRIAYEVMAIWFGSVHGLSTALTFVLYNLCAHPEYIKPLRAEIESSAVDAFFMTGEGLPLLDSFLKECSRMTPVESVTTRRMALKRFTFSDGTRLEKGDWTCIPVGAMLKDDTLYPQPDEFNGFRFADPKLFGETKSVQPEGPSKFTDVLDNWQVWGTGKMTCPGRFFVSYVMKHIMLHILENYDPGLVNEKAPNTITWRSLTLPRPGVKINFRPRE